MLQVAAYCRVSTDKEDQANSFEAQQRYFRDYIERQPDWVLQGIYADEGISGTSTRKRVEFNKMLHAAELGQIDLIVTKEVSRFTRNTVDALQITRDLRRRGVGVLFLNDSLDTRTNDGELRLTIPLRRTRAERPQNAPNGGRRAVWRRASSLAARCWVMM